LLDLDLPFNVEEEVIGVWRIPNVGICTAVDVDEVCSPEPEFG